MTEWNSSSGCPPVVLCQVAACMENRSEEMVKALYNMTKVRK